MLIPYGSDAPLYHLPISTCTMIALNVAIFLGMLALEPQSSEDQLLLEQFQPTVEDEELREELPDEQPPGDAEIPSAADGQRLALAQPSSLHRSVRIREALMLQYGRLRPWQWVTSNFMHDGWLHLLGNMFCLWGFGFVVEGKIGWWQFLLVYLGIGVTQCAAEQTMMLFASHGGSLGASAIIYGLLAICVVWAPENEMNCILLAGFRVITFDAPLYTIGTTAVIIELVTGYFGGLTIASQVLHLMGAGLGFAVGAGMLKMGWVDCEGWDLFNVWAGTQNKARDEEADAAKKIVREATERRLQELTGRQDAAPAAASAPLTMDDLGSIGAPLETPQPSDQALADVRQAIAAGDPQQAFARFQRLAADPLTSELPEAELLRIIGLYHKQKLWSPSVPALVEYLRHFQAKETQVRLWLARILVQVEKRPAQALAVLAKLPADKLKDEERALAAQLRARAKQLQSPPSPNAASEH